MLRKNRSSVNEIKHNEIAVAVTASDIFVAAYESVSNSSEGAESPEILTQRFAPDSENLSEQIGVWAKKENIAVSLDTPFLINCAEFHERTQLLALPDDAPRTDEDLPHWLMQSARQNTPGADGKPLFGAKVDLDNTAFLHFNLLNGAVALTRVPSRDLSLCAEKLVDFSSIKTDSADVADPVLNLQIETPTRAIARYYFNTCAVPNDALEQPTAFLSISPKGYAYGIFSPHYGDLVYETAEPFDNKGEKNSETEDETDLFAGIEFGEDFFENDTPSSRIAHAVKEMLADCRKTLTRFSLGDIGKIIWTTSAEMHADCEEALTAAAEKNDFTIFALGLPLEEVIAYGLLLSTDEESSLQTVNLVRDLVSQSNEEEIELLNQQAIKDVRHKQLTVYAMTIPFIAILALTIGLLIDTARSSNALSSRETAAADEKAALAPTLEIWNSYSKTFEIYETYTKQVITLRDGQDRAINLFTELDSRYPLSLDGSFFVSDLKLSAGGGLEMKGMARDEQAIKTFVESLETSQLARDGKYEKTFGTSLTFDLQQGTDKLQSTAATASAPNVLVWSVKGVYAPLATAPKPLNDGTPNGAVPAASNPTNPALTPANNLNPNQVVKSAR